MEVDYGKEGISTLSIRSFLRALRYLLIILKLLPCLCVLKIFYLLRFNPYFYLQECYEVFLKTLFEKVFGVKKFDF